MHIHDVLDLTCLINNIDNATYNYNGYYYTCGGSKEWDIGFHCGSDELWDIGFRRDSEEWDSIFQVY